MKNINILRNWNKVEHNHDRNIDTLKDAFKCLAPSSKLNEELFAYAHVNGEEYGRRMNAHSNIKDEVIVDIDDDGNDKSFYTSAVTEVCRWIDENIDPSKKWNISVAKVKGTKDGWDDKYVGWTVSIHFDEVK